MKKIQFYIRFHTQYGQSLFVTGNINVLGNGDLNKAVPLKYLNKESWCAKIDVPASVGNFSYSYYLKNADGTIVEELGGDRIIDIAKSGFDEYQAIDTWNYAGEFQNAFYTAPFQQVLLKEHKPQSKSKAVKNYSHVFKVKAPLLKKNEIICLLGSSAGLGEWIPADAILLEPEGHWWVARLELSKDQFPVAYKYGIYNIKHKGFVRFEDGPNRLVHGDGLKQKVSILHDGFAQFPNAIWKGSGVAIPVFSLRSKDSFGVGEFNDLKLLVDWANKTGLQLIQILPINDTTATHSWKDSYPYAAITAFALHPIYLNLEKVAGKEFADLVKPLRKKQKQLNELKELDYGQVISFKTSVIKELFLAQKDKFLKEEGFQSFFKDHKHWLVPYAAFCYLRDRNKTPDFSKWKIYSKYDKAGIEKYVSPRAKHYNEIACIYFTQYHLHLQLKEAAEYAHKHGVVLKGDIPIGIFRYSCDAWMNPSLYHMELQAGAPPDDFAITGQNWGFPTYNWRKMEEDGFRWWRKRFEQLGDYFDAFRIDHILGFFRIWSIPIHEIEGIMGYFDPAIPVHVNEFREKGIWFDFVRYTQPFINEPVLWEMFGPNKDKFKPFLMDIAIGAYKLKEEFNTQQKVEQYFATKEDNEDNRNIKQGLYDLISNVILFEVAGSDRQQFHFRFGIENTSSFRYLDWNTQQQLKELYVNYFFRRQDDFWFKEAMKKLPAMKKATNMLVCGEDLGMVPHCVPDVMTQLGLLSLEVQRMPKDPGKEFFNPADAPYLSVVSPSTHDMSTIRGWWEEDPERTQKFYNQELGLTGKAPSECEPSICRAIVQQHLNAPAMWSIFMLQDLLGIDEKLRHPNPHEERINIPADPKHFWKYRMHVFLEDLIKAKEFNEELKDEMDKSGRG